VFVLALGMIKRTGKFIVRCTGNRCWLVRTRGSLGTPGVLRRFYWSKSYARALPGVVGWTSLVQNGPWAVRALQMASSIIVQKYGGVCLETPTKVLEVAKDIVALHRQGHRIVVIVSAMGKTTDELVRMAYRVSPHPNRRELDMLLSTGERISMSLMSMALMSLGAPAISFTGSQAGVLTDQSHSSARIIDVKPTRVREELGRQRIVVLAGFQGVNPVTKEITTLGRGGSDTTAVAVAAVLKADRCEIIKDVDGICSGDPRVVQDARRLQQLDFASLCEMCFWGAKVLHFRSAQLAQSQNVPLVVRKWGAAEGETIVRQEVADMEAGKVLAVNSIARIEQIEVDSQNLAEGLETLAAHIEKHQHPWPQIIASAFEAGKARFMLSADAEALDAFLHTLNGPELRTSAEAVASVSLTCSGGVSSDLPIKAMKILQREAIACDKYILSPHSLSFFIAPAQREAAVRALHSLVSF
jgi:aspartate kinase